MREAVASGQIERNVDDWYRRKGIVVGVLELLQIANGFLAGDSASSFKPAHAIQEFHRNLPQQDSALRRLRQPLQQFDGNLSFVAAVRVGPIDQDVGVNRVHKVHRE